MSDVLITDYARRKAKRINPRETMLRDFLEAKTPQEKRAVITNFAPHYFIFGNTLDPRNPYEGENHESV